MCVKVRARIAGDMSERVLRMLVVDDRTLNVWRDECLVEREENGMVKAML